MGQAYSGNFCYDLSSLNNNIKDDEYYQKNNLQHKYYVYNKETFTIIKYIKNLISDNNCKELGKFRSVILKDNELKVFSPPKSLEFNNFIENNNIEDVTISEFIEGTMVNLFWNNNKWEISTKSSVGGNVSFFTVEKTLFARKENTFRYMFEDCLKHYNKNLTIDTFLDINNNEIKNCCFSFVMQHPTNRIVVPFTEPNIYLVAIYNINNLNVTRVNITDNLKSQLPEFIKYPKIYENYKSYEELVGYFDMCDYKTVGIMITNKNTFDRTKIRNKNYEKVKFLRGNQPKLQYRYLMLRQTKQITEYLTYYPEQKDHFDTFRNQVQEFTKDLYNEYVKCFIQRNTPFKMCKYHLKHHMQNLHNIYLTYIKQNYNYKLRKITFNIVKDYVNNLPPAKLMYSINYPFYNKDDNENVESNTELKE